MVEMVTGEEISMADLGGPEIHARHSGSADLVAEDEEHARELVAQLISYLPANSNEDPPRSDPVAPVESPMGIDRVVPESPNRGYDMRDLVDRTPPP